MSAARDKLVARIHDVMHAHELDNACCKSFDEKIDEVLRELSAEPTCQYIPDDGSDSDDAPPCARIGVDVCDDCEVVVCAQHITDRKRDDGLVFCAECSERKR